MLEANTRSVLARFCDNNWEKAKDVVKLCCVKKHVGDGGELEHTLDDVLGIWVTVQSRYEKHIEINLYKSHYNSPTVAKVFENKFTKLYI